MSTNYPVHRALTVYRDADTVIRNIPHPFGVFANITSFRLTVKTQVDGITIFNTTNIAKISDAGTGLIDLDLLASDLVTAYPSTHAYDVELIGNDPTPIVDSPATTGHKVSVIYGELALYGDITNDTIIATNGHRH